MNEFFMQLKMAVLILLEFVIVTQVYTLNGITVRRPADC